jgi:hypothetical protein
MGRGRVEREGMMRNMGHFVFLYPFIKNNHENIKKIFHMWYKEKNVQWNHSSILLQYYLWRLNHPNYAKWNHPFNQPYTMSIHDKIISLPI